MERMGSAVCSGMVNGHALGMKNGRTSSSSGPCNRSLARMKRAPASRLQREKSMNFEVQIQTIRDPFNRVFQKKKTKTSILGVFRVPLFLETPILTTTVPSQQKTCLPKAFNHCQGTAKPAKSCQSIGPECS